MAGPRLCPICNRPLDSREDALRFRPFCSKRCADIDLGRWLRGSYAITAAETDDSETGAGDDPESRGGEEDDASPVRH